MHVTIINEKRGIWESLGGRIGKGKLCSYYLKNKRIFLGTY